MHRWRIGIGLAALLMMLGCAQPPAPHASQAAMSPMFGPPHSSAPVFATAPPAPTGAPNYPAYPAAATTPPPPPATAPASMAGQWALQDKPISEPVVGGANHYELKVVGPPGRVTMDVVVFDSRRFRLQVIDQPNPNAGSKVISDVMRAYRASAGVNGGFFDAAFAPLGLMISGGKSTGRYDTAGILYGLVLEVDSQPYVIWNAEYQGTQGVTDLLQSGPRLVNSGHPIDGLKRDNPRPRTFVATDGGFMWALGVTSSCDLGALGDLLSSPAIIPDLPVMRALNLDGGRSTAIWMRTSTGKEISRPGWSTVRNYLAIVPR